MVPTNNESRPRFDITPYFYLSSAQCRSTSLRYLGSHPAQCPSFVGIPFYQSFSYIPRIRCLVMDPTIRVVGAVSLWAIEIVMQLRVYALFNCSRKVGLSVSNALLATQTLLTGRNFQRNTLHILCGRLCCTVGERFGRTS